LITKTWQYQTWW